MLSAHALHSEEKKKGLRLNWIWEQDEEIGSEICVLSLYSASDKSVPSAGRP